MGKNVGEKAYEMEKAYKRLSHIINSLFQRPETLIHFFIENLMRRDNLGSRDKPRNSH
jgi:hypothetical protein